MKLIYFLIATTLLFTACDSKKADGTFKLTFGHIANDDNTWHKAAMKFKELVEERSKGKITVEVHGKSSIGKEMELIRGIQLGTADMTITGESLQNWAPKAALMAIPYAFESSEQMRAAAGGAVGKEICDEITKETGLVPIAWFERGPRHLTTNRPIKTPADLNGLKIRVPNVPIFVKVWEALGAKPTPMAFSEVFTSLQQNTIEAQENPLSLIDSASFCEVQKNVNLTAHVRSWIYVVIGKKKLESMPEDLQKIVMDCAKEMQEYENKLFIEEEKQLRTKLEKAGMTFVDADQNAFAEKAKSAVLKALSEEQRKLLEQIKN